MSKQLKSLGAVGALLVAAAAFAVTAFEPVDDTLPADGIDESPAAPEGGSQDDDVELAPITATEAHDLLAVATIADPVVVDYDRDDFGQRWKDIDRNGCDTRNDMLRRDLTGVTYKPGTHDCVVLTGTLADPYSGTAIAFERGESTSSLVQIDHVIPLSWAAQQGALDWSLEQRERFANDPLNLLAVDGSQNASKGDSGPSEWMPDNDAAHCGYAARFTAVLAEYQLSIPPADHAHLEDVLAACTDGDAS